MNEQQVTAETWPNNPPPSQQGRSGAISPQPTEDPSNQNNTFKSDDNVNRPAIAEHAVVAPADEHKEEGKRIDLVHAPVQSLHATTGKKHGEQKKADIKVFDNPNRYLNHRGVVHDFAYPFEDTKVGQAFFVPVENDTTVDKLVADIHHKVDQFVNQTSECEKDDKGDDVWESVVIQTKKRTQDGLVQLNSDGTPIVGANQTNRPKLIHSASFIVRPIVAGDELVKDGQKAEQDGVMVVRVM